MTTPKMKARDQALRYNGAKPRIREGCCEAAPAVLQKLLFCSAKREVTDSPSEMRRIVSANRNATESWRTLAHFFPWAASGIVSVTTTSSSLDAWMRSIAGPEKTACVQYEYTFFAPRSFS